MRIIRFVDEHGTERWELSIDGIGTLRSPVVAEGGT